MRTIANKHPYVDPVCQTKVTKNSQVPYKYLQVKPGKRKGLWRRYLDRLNKATGGRPPCCH
jgi:hypothetical protein